MPEDKPTLAEILEKAKLAREALEKAAPQIKPPKPGDKNCCFD